MKRFKHPFTLVELLCVIIVIALLAAISIKVTQIAYRRADETKTKTLSVKGLSGVGQDLFKGGALDLSAGSATVTLPPRESRFYLFNK